MHIIPYFTIYIQNFWRYYSENKTRTEYTKLRNIDEDFSVGTSYIVPDTIGFLRNIVLLNMI